MIDTPNDFTQTSIPTEAELASFDHRAVSSPVEIIGDVRITAEPTLSGVPPAMREEVAAKMANVKADHAIFERQFIREALRPIPIASRSWRALARTPTSTSASASASCGKSTT